MFYRPSFYEEERRREIEEEAVLRRESTVKKMLSRREEEFKSNFKRTITPTKQRKREELDEDYGGYT